MQLAELVNTEDARKSVEIKNAFPFYVEVPSIGEVQPARPLLYSSRNYNDAKGLSSSYSSLILSIEGAGNQSEYWNVAMDDQRSANNETNGVVMIAFVDKVFPSAFDSFTGGG